ncbi:hypothetical protein FPE01S_02_09280 [Flavihumibacter petaseus NBRC 106054]|uniref:Uncharacterized protein n=1 Tax=Flavihumibacter petaseus NBRC 106054 TaxID=1220578 RepID=A0A0E9N1B6_9BACT|nr:hypothetical protein FPE01S_02_09280 [Flavihumibacter petaseus NBRC 106054]
MPWYRITFSIRGVAKLAYRNLPSTDIDEVFRDIQGKCDRRFGFGTVQDFDCVMISRWSTPFKEFEKHLSPRTGKEYFIWKGYRDEPE